MAASASSLGRDIVFRLRLQTDPQEWDALKKLADETDKARKKLRDGEKAAGNERKKEKTQEQREAEAEARQKDRLEKVAARRHVSEQFKAMDEVRKRKAKEAAEDIRLREQTDRVIARNHLRATLKAIDDEERARIQAARRVQRENERAERTALKRSAKRLQGASGLIGAASDLGRGVAYSGLVGERNTETILNTLLAVESGSAIVRGGSGLMRSVDDLAIPGVTSGGVAASLAAIVAWLPAVVSGLHAVAAYAGSQPGDPESKFIGAAGAGIATTYTGAAGALGAGGRNWVRRLYAGNAAVNTLVDPYFRAADTSDEVARQPGSIAAYRASQAMRLAELRDRGRTVSDAFGASLGGSARDRARGVNALNQASIRDMLSTTGGGKEELSLFTELLRLKREARDITAQELRERLEGTKQELASVQRIYEVRKAESARVREDYIRFASLNPYQQMALRTVALKTRAGAELSPEEAELAGGFSAFRGASDDSNLARARRAGADFIFGAVGASADDAKRREEEARAAVQRLEINAKQQLDVIVKVESDSLSDPAEKELIEKLQVLITASTDKSGKQLLDEVKRLMTLQARARGA